MLPNEPLIYHRIGEFAVAFQWLEHKLREIGWFIIDPDRKNWPPKDLRSLTNENLVKKVHELFIQALPKCKLGASLEADFNTSFASCVASLHQLRRDRNRILHSAFIELKAGDEDLGLMRSNLKLAVDEETSEIIYDQEMLTPDSFAEEMRKMAEVALFLNRAYLQLIHRYPDGGTAH